MFLYARHEPTTDSEWCHRMAVKVKGDDLPCDVVFYYDERCVELAGRMPWHYGSKPTKRKKRQTLNGYVYDLVWLEKSEVSHVPAN